MKRVIMTKGLPASGKTTWAKQQLADNPHQYKRINKDDLRAMLDGGKWSRGNEKFVLAARDALILQSLAAGYHVIVDDTNLHRKHETHIRELVKGQAEVTIQDFTHVPLEECITRDLQRPNSVGERVIRRMNREYLAASTAAVSPVAAPIAILPGAPWVIICDLDGTLALLNGRNPYDATTCEQDLLNVPIKSILDSALDAGHANAVILMSGRQEQDRPPTERWLATHQIRYSALYMRPTDDTRRDADIKRELYEQHIAGNFNVRFVLDDRNQVVDLWRSLGLTCLQVNYGDF